MPVRTGAVDFSALDFGNFSVLWTAVDIRLGDFNSLWLAGGEATLCAALGFVLAMEVGGRPDSRRIAIADTTMEMQIGRPGTVFGVVMLWAFVGSRIYATVRSRGRAIGFR